MSMDEGQKGLVCLVTGATGFVGGALCRQLAGAGHRVKALYRDDAKLEALAGMEVEPVKGDIVDRASLDAACDGVDLVFHLAALFRQAGFDDQVYRDINVGGTRNVFDAAIAAGARRIVHCSTGGVHSHIPDPPADENEPYRPGDIYQETKCEGEKLALEYFRSDRIRGAVIRPAMIWGPGDTRTQKLFVGIARRRMPIIGNGEVYQHWVLMEDVARGMILAGLDDSRSGEVYIIAGEQAHKLREVFQIIAQRLGVKLLPFRVPAVPIQLLGDVVEKICIPFGVEPPIYRRRVDFFTKSRYFDWSKARDQLGYRPSHSFEEEVDMIIDSYRAMGVLP